jgi:hypothetical protein
MRIGIVTAVCFVLALWSRPCGAQDTTDIGVLGGWIKPSNEGSVLQFNFGTAYEVSFARRVWSNARTDLAIEVPFIAANSISIKTPGASLPREYAVLSLTPGIRVRLPLVGKVAAFGAIGGGFAAYDESKLRADGSQNPGARSNSTGAVSIGGGVDVRSGSWLGLRGEVRDVITGARRFSIPTPGERVHNVVTTFGLVIHL